MDELALSARDAAGVAGGRPSGAESLAGRTAPEAPGFRPTFQVIALDCEITAYAPDEGDEPLF